MNGRGALLLLSWLLSTEPMNPSAMSYSLLHDDDSAKSATSSYPSSCHAAGTIMFAAILAIVGVATDSDLALCVAIAVAAAFGALAWRQYHAIPMAVPAVNAVPVTQLNSVVVHGVPAGEGCAGGTGNTTPPPDAVLSFTVNGTPQRLVNPSPSLLLVDYLRDDLGLTGTKVGCGEGGCGACTCVATGADGVPRAINSCLRLLCACDGLEITTVEGFGSQSTGFSAVQKAIADGQGSQCGFCTPGWVSAMEAMLARAALKGQPPLTAKQIETSLDGNICRCTGYRPILQAFKEAFAVPDLEDLGSVHCHDVRTKRPCGRECDRAIARAEAEACHRAAGTSDTVTHGRAAVRCKAANPCDPAVAPVATVATVASQLAPPTAVSSENTPGSTPPPFTPPFTPPAVASTPPPRALCFTDATHDLSYHRPAALADLLRLLKSYPAAQLVAANTGMGVAKYYAADGPTGASGLPPQRHATLIDVTRVPEMGGPPKYDPAGRTLTLGASVTIEALVESLDAVSSAQPAAHPAAVALARHLRRVATTQVRAVGTWAGNLAIAAAAPALPSDVLTLLGATRTALTLAARSTGSLRTVTLADYVAAGGDNGALIVSGVVQLGGDVRAVPRAMPRPRPSRRPTGHASPPPLPLPLWRRTAPRDPPRFPFVRRLSLTPPVPRDSPSVCPRLT